MQSGYKILICFYLQIIFANCSIKVYIVRLFEECPEFKNSVIEKLDLKIRYTADRELNVSYAMSLTRKLTERLRLDTEITRCKSREALDTCVPFLNLKTTKFCKMLELTNQFYSPFLRDCVTPRPKCPIEKGIYRGENCTLNMGLYNMYPLIYGYYWKAKAFLVNDETDEIIHCGIAEGFFRRGH